MNRFRGVSKIALILLAFVVPVVAQKPIIQLAPFTSFFAPAGEPCGFDVLLTPQPGRPNGEREIIFTNAVIVTGPLLVNLQNISTGKTTSLNTSGPGKYVFSATTTTVVLMGPAIIGPLPATVATAAGVPQWFLHDGQVVMTYDDLGNLTSISVGGNTKVQDVCQLLQ